jgi:fructuronate reductase
VTPVSRLSAATLAQAVGADRPPYDRTAPPAIVHLGVGAFARAHLAVYADDLLRAGWPATVAGVSLRSPRAEAQLGPQDGLFTVTEREPSAPPSTRVIGSLASIETGADAACRRIADPSTTLVTLTVTEKAYELDGPDAAPAILATALDGRRSRTDDPLVVASLDNLLDNGTVLRDRVLGAANIRGAGLREWIEEHVRFPRSVVDRMVPATTHADRAEIAASLGLVDEAATVAEAHRSWVLEAVDGLPPLGNAGVEVVDEIGPYQQRKLWLLNGPHSALAYVGLLAGHVTIADAATNPSIDRFVRRLVDDVLAVAPQDSPTSAFAEQSLRRFANPALGHTCAQVGADGSRKLPQRLLPVIERRVARGMSTDRFDLVIAAWLAAVTSADVHAAMLPPIEDPAADALRDAMRRGGPEAAVLSAFGAAHGGLAVGIADAYDCVVREGLAALEERS